ncbi:MAG: GNAT family N-acetyltransferase [Austwickia sp.]|nr:GNAT family N-acetyltransferase [Actinomycetota bacterium]MCO5309143.1 GNAT family N-acetyltransferase [Austwickia sp.]
MSTLLSIEDEHRHYQRRAAELHDRIVLRDGTPAWVGPLQHKDRADLAREYDTLSDASKWHRFLGGVPHLNAAMLDALVDDVDGLDHVALIVFVDDHGEPTPAGIGRIVRHEQVPDAADIAITVKDAWQGRGIASALVPRLVAARPAGVTHLLTEISTDNAASLALARHAGTLRIHPTGGAFDIEVDLDDTGLRFPPPADGGRLHPALAAEGRDHLHTRDHAHLHPATAAR